jgi:Fes/CIP4/EFC/F-BAR domain-containing protein
MQASKQTCDELRSFYNGKPFSAREYLLEPHNLITYCAARASLEDEYARRLLALCRKPLGSQETGSLRTSFDTLRGEVESMGRQHQNIAAQMKSELEEPLAAFAGGMKERRKIVQNGIEKLHKVKVQQTQQVNKVPDYGNSVLNTWLRY